MRRTFVVAVVMALAACSHGKSAKRDGDGDGDGAKKALRSGRKMSPEDRTGGTKQGEGPKAPKIHGAAEPMTTSKTTKKMFKPEGLKKLQDTLDKKLADIGKKNDQLEQGKKDEVEEEKAKMKVPLPELDGVEQSGELDAATQEALRAFQRSERLPETGLPDYESLRRLGIKPNEIFEHETPAERGAVK